MKSYSSAVYRTIEILRVRNKKISIILALAFSVRLIAIVSNGNYSEQDSVYFGVLVFIYLMFVFSNFFKQ